MSYKPTKGYASGAVVKLEVEGLSEALASLRRMGDAGKKAGRGAMLALTDRMVTEAKPLTPDDPATQGALRDSVRSIRPTMSNTKGTLTGGIMAGGKALEERLGGRAYSAWALVQHEDLTIKHPYGGGPKYLERPFMARVQDFVGMLLEAMDKETA